MGRTIRKYNISSRRKKRNIRTRKTRKTRKTKRSRKKTRKLRKTGRRLTRRTNQRRKKQVRKTYKKSFKPSKSYMMTPYIQKGGMFGSLKGAVEKITNTDDCVLFSPHLASDLYFDVKK